MGISTFVTAGPASTTANAGRNNFACFQCHNGLTSIAYQDNVQGTSAAPVVFGDATVTCVTCHDPHRNVTGNTKNTRKPQVMTNYNSGGLTFSGNVFLDNTPVPAETGNATICVYCHQGRESGYTLFQRRLKTGATTTGSFLNEHYLGTGAMLWGKNAYEYGGKSYGAVTAHQQANCTTCHMTQSGRDDLGGHSWKIAAADDTVNNTSCNTASCHSGRVPATKTALENFRDTSFDPTNDYDGNGTADGIPVEISNLCIQLKDLLAANGVFYSDLNYPYFLSDAALTLSFSAWTPSLLKAAFNLQFVIKGLPSAAVTQVGLPNPSAAVHNYRYNIQILRDSYDNLWAILPAGQLDRSAQARPTGNRLATNYNPTGGGYDPLQ
jgi:hypothetical protein